MGTTGIAVSTLRIWAGVLVVAGLLAATVVFYTLTSESPGGAAGGSDPGRGGRGPQESGGEPSDPTPAPDRPGIVLTARMSAGGGFDVSEQVMLRRPTRRIVVGPPDLSAAGDGLAALRPYASKVQVIAGEQAVSVTLGEVRGRRTFRMDTPVKRLTLRYHLDGATVRSLPPSKAGRALAGIAPLTMGVAADLPVRVVAEGGSILNLTCPRLPAPEVSCVAGSPPRLHVDGRLPLAQALVVVQLDLPDD